MYEVNTIAKKGSMDSSLFDKMAKNGDIQAIKISDILGEVVSIIGYAECEIVTDTKNFSICYYDTKEKGIISSGSLIFRDSVLAYYGEVEKVRITEVKTKKGTTYKAVPELTTTNNEPKTNEELPF